METVQCRNAEFMELLDSLEKSTTVAKSVAIRLIDVVRELKEETYCRPECYKDYEIWAEQCYEKCYYVERLELPKKAIELVRKLVHATRGLIYYDADVDYESARNGIVYIRRGDVAVLYSPPVVYVIRFI